MAKKPYSEKNQKQKQQQHQQNQHEQQQQPQAQQQQQRHQQHNQPQQQPKQQKQEIHISDQIDNNHNDGDRRRSQDLDFECKLDEEPEHLGSFLLIDENELMQVESVEEFAEKLGCEASSLIKVVSIFGSIGHGKSYTLNHAFYECQEVFQTSSSQESCTVGIWAAYDEKRRVITLDTEGLLGVSANCQRRTRLLLKVLAISDIIIYRTKSERLEDNLFTFLGDASRVYVQHFFKELQNAFHRLPELSGQPCLEMGPVVIIFQETRDTEPLKQEADQTREHIIRSRFKTLGLTTEAFSAIEYVGIQTPVRPTNFDQLKSCIKRHIKNSFSRTPRPLSVIYTTLKILNEKFNGDIERTVPSMFPNQYLTCPTTCLSCNARCTNSMNHHRDGLGHKTDSKCIYQHQFKNHILYCKACYERGDDVEVTPKTCSSNESAWLGLAKYAWAGYVIECPRCGIIHRSRQYWFGNKETWESSIRTEIKHVWQGELNKMLATQNAAQRVLDSVSYITETVTTIGAKPTKMVSEWVADQIAPNYWIPNSMLLQCALCNNQFGVFDQKHHCRLCGNGLCSTCSSKFKPVPERGWGETSVRVCDRCYERSDHLSAISSLPPLPPMLMLQATNNQGPITNGFTTDQHNNLSLTDETEIVEKQAANSHQQQKSSSIPIPQASCRQQSESNGCKSGSGSRNTTPTTPQSSSIGSSSSSGSNHQSLNNRRASIQNGYSTGAIDQLVATESLESIDASGKNQGAINISNNYSLQTTATATPNQTSNGQEANGNTGGSSSNTTSTTVTARKFGEVLQSTFKTVVSTAIDYPLGVIKDTARPDYWLPDSQISGCGLCKKSFNELVPIHHCRRCGGGFCQECSAKTAPVPERGWSDASVRVCDKCFDMK